MQAPKIFDNRSQTVWFEFIFFYVRDLILKAEVATLNCACCNDRFKPLFF